MQHDAGGKSCKGRCTPQFAHVLTQRLPRHVVLSVGVFADFSPVSYPPRVKASPALLRRRRYLTCAHPQSEQTL